MNMNIGVFQDVHANLPALKKAIEIFRMNDCEKIFHVGDLIGIGPYPKECLELSLSIEEMEFIMGNHDYLYPFGIPNLLSAEEKAHQEWTHLQIGNSYKAVVQKWPFVKHIELSNQRKIIFQHYGVDEKTKWFKAHIAAPNETDLDRLFDYNKADIIFYGHNHVSSDITGMCRYVNLGSAGCFSKAEVRIGILKISDDELNLEKLSVPYDDDGFMEEFEIREVPAREFIKKNFISRS
jgi:predicted phosphodiesterase